MIVYEFVWISIICFGLFVFCVGMCRMLINVSYVCQNFLICFCMIMCYCLVFLMIVLRSCARVVWLCAIFNGSYYACACFDDFVRCSFCFWCVSRAIILLCAIFVTVKCGVKSFLRGCMRCVCLSNIFACAYYVYYVCA